MFKSISRLLRWQNLLFIAILLWCMEKWVASAVLRHIGFPEVLPWWVLLLIIVSTILIAAGGYVINDYFDVKIDRINRPESLVITNTITKETAMRLFQILTLVGVLCGLSVAWLLKDWTLATIFLFVPGLLWFYSASYKRMLIVGNLIVAISAALPPITIALANVAWLNMHYAIVMPYLPLQHDLFCWLGGFALFAFLCTITREIAKDLQDQNGDRELECHTIPICWGDMATKIILTILSIGILFLLYHCGWHLLPFPTSWQSPSVRYIVLGLFLPIIGFMALVWSGKIPSDYRSAQLLMKWTMFIGTLFSYVIFRLL